MMTMKRTVDGDVSLHRVKPVASSISDALKNEFKTRLFQINTFIITSVNYSCGSINRMINSCPLITRFNILK